MGVFLCSEAFLPLVSCKVPAFAFTCVLVKGRMEVNLSNQPDQQGQRVTQAVLTKKLPPPGSLRELHLLWPSWYPHFPDGEGENIAWQVPQNN